MVGINHSTMDDPLVFAHPSAAPMEGIDSRLSMTLAEGISNEAVIELLRQASRFGDWGLSVVVGGILAVVSGLAAFGLFAVLTAVAIIVQKALKISCGRLRPCQRPGGPPQRAPIPDAGSFPSGHTLHAVMGAWVISLKVVVLAPIFIVLAMLIALSRVVLGVHFPSDVAAGAALGALLAQVFVVLM